MDLNIFDFEFNLLGEISEYESLKIEQNYDKLSQLTLIIDGKKENIEKLQDGLILTTMDNPQIGYIIKLFDYVDEKGSKLEIKAPSLNYLLNDRAVEGQQRFSGNVEDVIKGFVNANAISPVNPNRIIPNLRLAQNYGIDETTDESKVGGQLDDYVYSLCNKFEMSFDIIMNHAEKKFDFTTWKGVDRSTQQIINSHVIFSKEFDNVIKQNYTHSDLNTKSVAIVAGEGEGAARKYITVNDELSGFDRKELFVDARDLQSQYTNENNVSKTLTPAEYEVALANRGLSKLAEHETIETFESEVDMYSQFVYGLDYRLGDVVSVANNDLGKILHTRISSAPLKCDRKGTNLSITFGSNIPTLLDKIKRMVK